jgi:hypothetical protein
MEDLHIVTVATESKYYFPYLIESCRRNGKELTILGYGKKWRGFNWRLKLMISYLQTLNPNDIVCFVDGYDVICLRNLNELKDEFLRISENSNAKIIIGYNNLEHTYSFYKHITNLFFGKTSNNLSLNAGTYMGYASNLLDVLNVIIEMNSDDDADDQILMTEYCNRYHDYHIDFDNSIFLTIQKSLQDISTDVHIEKQELIYNNNRPFFLHVPGCGYMDNILIKLDYKLSTSINDELYNNFGNKVLLYITPSILMAMLLVVLAIILIIYYVNLKFV